MSRRAVLFLLLPACVDPTDTPDPTPAENPLAGIPATADFVLPCLQGSAQVVRTEFDFPHIYAENRLDLYCAQAFVTARDRYFVMELGRRLGLGRLSELLGDQGLSVDVENRSIGMRLVADRIWEGQDEFHRAELDAYAQGVNAFVDGVRSGLFSPPPELDLLHGLLGAESAADIMDDWTAQDVTGMAATLVYQLGFETTDIGVQQAVEQMATWGSGLQDEALRKAAAEQDVWGRLEPIFPIASAVDFPASAARAPGADPGTAHWRLAPGVEGATLARAATGAERIANRLGRRGDEEFGSNAWAVAPSGAADGVALVASDGHLPLSVPSLFYNVHLDTTLVGDGSDHAIGISLPGIPMVVLGSNGSVGWGQTQLGNDVNDWYREEIVLGKDGRPTATAFQGGEKAVREIPESYEVAGVLDSTARTVTISRWETDEGRMFFEIEGTTSGEATGAPSEINVRGTWVVASDVDGDGVITGISGAYTGWEERFILENVEGFGDSETVDDFAVALSGAAAYSQNMIAADVDGNILYSGFEAMPCRGYLPRDGDGIPLPGANPQLLIDGSLYESFRVTHTADHRIDPAPDDPLTCMYDYEQYPHSKNPAQGYLVTANQSTWGTAFDGDLWNDGIYTGGPWMQGHRAEQIRTRLEAGMGNHTVETTSELQGLHESFTAGRYLDELLTALDTAEAYAADGELIDAPGRMAALWASHGEAADEARTRLRDWQQRGLMAASGVQTFYDDPDATAVDDAIATMIWNAFLGKYIGAAIDDEGLPGIWRPSSGREGRARLLEDMLAGRGPGNPAGSAGWNPATEEHVFWDHIGTVEVESSSEIAVSSFTAALDQLSGPGQSDRSGGFNSADQGRWIWGLKHFVKFESIINQFLGDDPTFSAIGEQFAINNDVLPLDSPLPTAGDPRWNLPGYPRPGDSFGIDAAGGPSNLSWSYGSGPVMRFVVAMDPAGIHGVNVIPGGQSAYPDSPYFADQAELWLANQTFPLRYAVADVIGNAAGRELLRP